MSHQSTLDGDRPAASAGGEPVLRRKAVPEADSGFTDWVGRSLHEAFDPIADEPLPHEFAALLNRLDRSAHPRT